MNENTLITQLETYIKEVIASKKSTTLEDALQATLNITTPEQPGDLRNVRKWKNEGEEDDSEWL